jgi:hypothetical protein
MKTILVVSLYLLTFNLGAQSFEKPDMDFSKGEKFDDGSIIIVIGDKCDSVEFYQKRIDRMRRHNSKARVKRENELTEDDFAKNLYFYGLLSWYNRISEYGLPISKINKGFKIGDHEFDNALDAIWLTNSNETRRLYLGNSYEAFQDRGGRGAYDYIIIRNGKRIHWGNLVENNYKADHHINSLRVRPQMLNRKIKLDYLNIHFPDNLAIDESYIGELKDIKKSLDIIIDLLDLQQPDYTIESYVYKDAYQKTILSCHDGYGVAYPEWKEINVIYSKKGNNNVLIHESIHILFDSEMKNMDNSCLLGEGIVGYAMYSLDSTRIRRDNEKSTLCFDEPIETWFDERVNTGNAIQASKLYPVSASWTRFLIDNYGLSRFKDLYRIPNSQLKHAAYNTIYGKTIENLTEEYKEFVKNEE